MQNKKAYRHNSRNLNIRTAHGQIWSDRKHTDKIQAANFRIATQTARPAPKNARRNSGGICLLVHNGQAQPCAHASTAHGGGEREEAKSFEMFAIMAGRDGQAGSAEGQRRALASLESA